MNIGILSTWDSNCGIAEYTKNLVSEFLIAEHKVTVFGNHGNCPDSEEHSEFFNVYKKLWGVAWWGENPTFYYDKILSIIVEQEIEVLFIQYQSSLYDVAGFNKLLEKITCKVIVTRHDSSVNLKHNFYNVCSTIVHNVHLGIPGNIYIPFPLVDTIPVAFSFGMGRNNYDLIEDVCTSIDIDFDWHDSRVGGWIDSDALFDRMTEADVIVLWYNDVEIKGQSSALRTAISSCRPIIVNDVGWFQDAPEFVHKVKTREELAEKLEEILHLDYIKYNSYKICAERYLEVANACL